MNRVRRMLAVLFTVALIATACGDDDGGDGNGFSSDLRDGYMQSCTSQQSVEYCRCTLDEIEQRFSEEDLIAFVIEQVEEPPEELIEIAIACLGEGDFSEE